MSNSHRNEKDDAKLLAGAFHDDWAHGPAGGFARAAAAHARRRRALRRTVVAATAASAAAAAVLISLRLRPEPAAPATIVHAPAIVHAPPKPAYEIISDDELIAQLRDRPLLVVKKENGTKEITLLEEPRGE